MPALPASGSFSRNCTIRLNRRPNRHVFFAEREVAKIPDVPRTTATKTIAQGAVIGAGTMGGGITMNFANAGIPVKMLELNREALDKGLGIIERNYRNTVKRGRLSQAQMDERMALISTTTSYDDIHDADLVIEAVFEENGDQEAGLLPSWTQR